MNRLPIALIVAASLAGTHAMSADWNHQSYSARRQTAGQIIDCMKKRMSDDRSISYNQAAKVCKRQVLAQREGSSSAPLVAADTQKH
jgi:hypothetical protein